MKDLPDNENIFSMSHHLTKEQLVQYHLGQMLKGEQYAVEKHLVDCELCKDALAGMALMPGYAGIDRIRKDIRKIAQPQKGLMNQVAWRNVVITAAVLSLIIFAALFYIYFTSTPKNTNDAAQPEPKEGYQPAPASSLHDSIATNMEKQTADSVHSSASPLPAAKNPAGAEQSKSKDKIEPIRPRSINNVEENFKRNDNVKLKKLPFPALYIADLKTVDYSERRTSVPYMVSKFETGIRAQFKDYNEQTDAMKEKAHETREVTYEKFLEDALMNYKNKNYDDALEKLGLIRSYFPHDLNAIFYSGLCYFELGRLDLAWSNFSLAGNNQNTTFSEEAKWYETLTDIKQKKIPEAKQLLSEIIDEDGFYKEQAKKKLAELK